MVAMLPLLLVLGFCGIAAGVVQTTTISEASGHTICRPCWRACRTCPRRCTAEPRCHKHFFAVYGRYIHPQRGRTVGRHYHPRGWYALAGVPANAVALALPAAMTVVGACAADLGLEPAG